MIRVEGAARTRRRYSSLPATYLRRRLVPWTRVWRDSCGHTSNINLSHDYAQVLVWRLRLDALRRAKAEYVRARRHGARQADAHGKLAVEFYESASRDVERRFAALVRRHRHHIKNSLASNRTHVE